MVMSFFILPNDAKLVNVRPCFCVFLITERTELFLDELGECLQSR